MVGERVFASLTPAEQVELLQIFEKEHPHPRWAEEMAKISAQLPQPTSATGKRNAKGKRKKGNDENERHQRSWSEFDGKK